MHASSSSAASLFSEMGSLHTSSSSESISESSSTASLSEIGSPQHPSIHHAEMGNLHTSSSSASLYEMESLRHPTHKHALNLRLFSENFICPERCESCKDQIHGSAYCCERCKFFLHKSCAELQSEIQHPFHQQHPLKMLVGGRYENCGACEHTDSFGFHCDDCGTRFCFRCIVSTMPDEDCHTRLDDDLTAHHFAHQHPLTLCHIGRSCQIECKMCMYNISGDVYGCYECVFFVHKKCAASSQEVEHPSHSKHLLTFSEDKGPTVDLCNACAKICCGSANPRGVSKVFCSPIYSCGQCKFYLHFACAILITEFQVSEHGGLFIDPFIHQHPLKSFHVKMENTIQCKVCPKNISGEVYGCADCIFFVHKSCSQLPLKIEYPHLHGGHSLALTVPDNPNILCKSCNEYIRGYAFLYSCQSCPYFLDVECALETLACLEQGGVAKLQHPMHSHPLDLLFLKPIRNFAEQRYCKCRAENVSGLVYKCLDYRCNFLLHKSCAELPLEMQHPYHAQHTLALQHSVVYLSCDACLGHSSIFYHCEKCGFNLDFPCVSRNPTFKHPLHKHCLSHFVEIRTGLHCKACGKSCTVDFYRCVQCNFNIHSDCLPQLPPKIKHKFHLDQLTFADSFVEDDSGEYICEFCGKDRDVELGVYYCEECPRESTLTAHMECAVAADTELAEKVRKIVKVTESPALAKLAELNEEIASVRAQLDTLKRERAAFG